MEASVSCKTIFAFIMQVIVVHWCDSQTTQISSATSDSSELGGKLAQIDFENAKNLTFQRIAKGFETNNDSSVEIFEGDIILDDYDYVGEVTTDVNKKWPKTGDVVIIPFTFPEDASEQERADIARTVQEFQTKTCIRLTERNEEPNWIHINTHSIGCLSRIGMKGGRQDIRAGGCLGNDGSWGKLAHEIMHSLGFYHQHSRPDRDTYITVNESAIELVEAEDFLFRQKKHYKICRNCRSLGPYDLQSLMHYPVHLGTKNRTVITIKDGFCKGSECRIGQRDGLSPLDVEDIQLFYDCAPKCYAETTQSSKFLQCANGNYAVVWNGCIDQGSVRVRCPKDYFPCNDQAENGEDFSCWKNCSTHGGVKNCSNDVLGLKKEQYKQYCQKLQEDDLCHIVNCDLDEAKKRCPKQCKEKQHGIPWFGNKLIIDGVVNEYVNHMANGVNITKETLKKIKAFQQKIDDMRSKLDGKIQAITAEIGLVAAEHTTYTKLALDGYRKVKSILRRERTSLLQLADKTVRVTDDLIFYLQGWGPEYSEAEKKSYLMEQMKLLRDLIDESKIVLADEIDGHLSDFSGAIKNLQDESSDEYQQMAEKFREKFYGGSAGLLVGAIIADFSGCAGICTASAASVVVGGTAAMESDLSDGLRELKRLEVKVDNAIEDVKLVQKDTTSLGNYIGEEIILLSKWQNAVKIVDAKMSSVDGKLELSLHRGSFTKALQGLHLIASEFLNKSMDIFEY